MGSFNQHATAALAVVVLATFILHFSPPWAVHVGVFLLGNLWPDIDHTKSKIHRYLGFPRLFGRRFKHWGRCHSVAGAILFSLPILALELAACWFAGWLPISWLAFVAGQIVHMLVDEACKSEKNKRKVLKWW